MMLVQNWANENICPSGGEVTTQKKAVFTGCETASKSLL